MILQDLKWNFSQKIKYLFKFENWDLKLIKETQCTLFGAFSIYLGLFFFFLCWSANPCMESRRDIPQTLPQTPIRFRPALKARMRLVIQKSEREARCSGHTPHWLCEVLSGFSLELDAELRLKKTYKEDAKMDHLLKNAVCLAPFSWFQQWPRTSIWSGKAKSSVDTWPAELFWLSWQY